MPGEHGDLVPAVEGHFPTLGQFRTKHFRHTLSKLANEKRIKYQVNILKGKTKYYIFTNFFSLHGTMIMMS